MKPWKMIGLIFALSTFVLSGCAMLGQQPREIEQAKTALEEARAAGAAESCPEAFAEAQEMWQEAKEQCPCDVEEARTKAAMAQQRAEKLCPDDDGDGVPNERDACPDTPPGVAVGIDGCTLDDDGDGVVNSEDQCPNTPVGVEVNAVGCEVGPEDSDRDGVNDKFDRCPDTPQGAKVDDMGCWVIGNIYFELDKDTIKPRYTEVLDEVAKVMKWNPEVTLSINGHTDDLAGEAYNKTLSRERAEQVKEYLIDMGVAADRMETYAYGENRPKVPNTTAANRALNRRVELIPDW